MSETNTETKSIDFESLQNRTVLFTIRTGEGDETTQVEGHVEAASGAGVAYKQKGKSALALLEAADIVSAEVLPEKPKVLKQAVLKPIALTDVRKHLADRHGINLSWLNNASNEDAEAFHNGIDHVNGENGPLGHRHEEPKADAKDAELAEKLAD